MSGRPTAEIVAEHVLGCCGDAEWRGHHCQYHQGFEAGLDEAADRLTELEAKLAAVNAALDQYDVDQRRGKSYVSVAALVCVSAIAKAVRP